MGFYREAFGVFGFIINNHFFFTDESAATSPVS